MLTGHVPFDGESAGEILMKHLTTPPDLSRVQGQFRPILDKALSKNPAHRYRSMAEMSRDVRSEEHTSELQSPYELVCRRLLEKKEELINTGRAAARTLAALRTGASSTITVRDFAQDGTTSDYVLTLTQALPHPSTAFTVYAVH